MSVVGEYGRAKNSYSVSLLIRGGGWVGVGVGFFLSWGSETGFKN